MTSSVHFSSETDEWESPDSVVIIGGSLVGLNIHPDEFDWDVCATPQNAKAPKFYTKEDNCLTKQWSGFCWMNPSYRVPERPCKARCKKKKCIKRKAHCSVYQPGTGDFVRKAYEEAQAGRATTVALLPSRTDTRWWHKYVEPVRAKNAHHVKFLKGRLTFGLAKNPAPFPSVLVAFSAIDCQPMVLVNGEK